MKFDLFKTASLLLAAVVLFSCGDVTPSNTDNKENEEKDDLTKDLVLVADKTIVHANGQDAVTFTVTLGSKVLTENVVFSDKEGEIITSINNFKFTTTQVGEYYVRAEYMTKMSALVKIVAMPMAVPATPVDPDKSNVSFRRRIMLTYFTGTGCPNCPRVKDMLKALETTDYKQKYIPTVVHQYGSDDPAWFEGSLPSAMGVPGYPAVTLNLRPGSTKPNSQLTESSLKTDIDTECADDALVGIAANAVYKDGKVIVKAAVKAAEKTKCRIGAWLLEDGIEYPQSGGTQPYHNIHDQSLRIADSKVSATDWSGYALGTIEAGKTVEHVFTMDMNPSWNAEKCHVVVFATTPVGNGYYVNNIVDVLLNDSVQFEYIK